MRIFNRYITFTRNEKLLKALEALHIPFKVKEKSYGGGVNSFTLEFFIYEDDKDFNTNTERIGQFEIEPQIGTEFSKKDEQDAKWFRIGTGQFGYPQPEDNYFEITYAKENVCTHCEIGKKQINPFRFRSEPKQNHSQFLGLNWVFDEIFVRDAVMKIFKNEKIEGIHFSHPIFNKNKLPLETLNQMHIETVLPKGLITDNLSFEICKRPTEKWIAYQLESNPNYLDIPFCGQKKYNYPKKGFMTFKKEIFSDNDDIVKTNEWFGSGGSASQPILISKKVRNIIKKQKWRGAYFQPISLI